MKQMVGQIQNHTLHLAARLCSGAANKKTDTITVTSHPAAILFLGGPFIAKMIATMDEIAKRPVSSNPMPYSMISAKPYGSPGAM